MTFLILSILLVIFAGVVYFLYVNSIMYAIVGFILIKCNYKVTIDFASSSEFVWDGAFSIKV